MNDSDKPDQPDQPETDDEMDVEGQSMFLYEGARHMARQQEQDAKRAARDAKLLKESKSENRK